MLSVTRQDVAKLIREQPRPTEETTSTGISPALAGFDRANEDLHAVLYLLTEKPRSRLVLKHEDETETSGHGQKPPQELEATYNKVTDEVIRATMEKLVSTSMNQGPRSGRLLGVEVSRPLCVTSASRVFHLITRTSN